MRKPSFLRDVVMPSSVVAWVIINAMAALFASDPRAREDGECEYKTRWSYVFPGFQFGCWMSMNVGSIRIEESICVNHDSHKDALFHYNGEGHVVCQDGTEFSVVMKGSEKPEDKKVSPKWEMCETHGGLSAFVGWEDGSGMIFCDDGTRFDAVDTECFGKYGERKK